MLTCFIGVPCVGKGSLVESVQSRLLDTFRIAVLTTSDIIKVILTDEDKEAMKGGGLFPREKELRDLLYRSVEACWDMGAQGVIIDGFPRFDDQVTWMANMFYDHPLQVIQVLAPSDHEIMRRAAMRNRDEMDGPEMVMRRVGKQRELLAGVEQEIFKHGIRYGSIINDDLNSATEQALQLVQQPVVKKAPKHEVYR
jgi:adenylate kinase family enzyme